MPEGRRKRELHIKIDGLLTADFEGQILPFDAPAAATHYAEIVASRERAGRPIRVRSTSRYRPAAPKGWCTRPLVCWRLNDSTPPMRLACRLSPSASSRSAGRYMVQGGSRLKFHDGFS
ncbi:putative nucleic acid-binding protein, contains PIN domain-containing protein [Mycobacterium haemophilum DSM 44634]